MITYELQLSLVFYDDRRLCPWALVVDDVGFVLTWATL